MMPQQAGKRLAREWRMAGVLESGGRFIGKRLQGGAKFPTGGIPDRSGEPASAAFRQREAGQQTW